MGSSDKTGCLSTLVDHNSSNQYLLKQLPEHKSSDQYTSNQLHQTISAQFTIHVRRHSEDTRAEKPSH